jgi:hypothetical protein
VKIILGIISVSFFLLSEISALRRCRWSTSGRGAAGSGAARATQNTDVLLEVEVPSPPVKCTEKLLLVLMGG